jgi:peptidoglycan/LPS O-acetylase OafA/YrhL
LDRKVVLSVALSYALLNVGYALTADSVGWHDRSRLAAFVGGVLAGILLMVPAYLSIRWGFILQLVLLGAGFLVNLLQIAFATKVAYTFWWIAGNIVSILFTAYIVWRLRNWERPTPSATR